MGKSFLKCGVTLTHELFVVKFSGAQGYSYWAFVGAGSKPALNKEAGDKRAGLKPAPTVNHITVTVEVFGYGTARFWALSSTHNL